MKISFAAFGSPASKTWGLSELSSTRALQERALVAVPPRARNLGHLHPVLEAKAFKHDQVMLISQGEQLESDQCATARAAACLPQLTRLCLTRVRLETLLKPTAGLPPVLNLMQNPFGDPSHTLWRGQIQILVV